MCEKKGIEIVSLHHKTHVAELWHETLPDSLQERAAALQEIYRLVVEQGLHTAGAPLNFCMPTGDLSWPAAALKAKAEGLPLHLAICGGCVADSAAQFLRTGAVPLSEQEPAALRAVLTALHADVPAGGTLPDAALTQMKQTLACGVVTPQRMQNFLRKIYEGTEYVAHPMTAAIYNVLQDYKVMWAESTPTVILALHDPMEVADTVAELLQISAADLARMQQSGRKRYEEY